MHGRLERIHRDQQREGFARGEANAARMSRHVCTNLLVEVVDPDHAEGVVYLTLHRHDGAEGRPQRQGARRFVPLLAVLCLALACAVDEPLRVTVIGIDGATWDVIDPMLAAGELPHIAKLMRRGVRARLRSEMPLWSPPVWTSVATGVPRKTHGIMRFATHRSDGAGIRLLASFDRRVASLWTLANDAGRRSAVLGWWMTYPAEDIDGVIVSERALKTRDADLRAMFPNRLHAPQVRRLTHPPEILTIVEGALAARPSAEADAPESERIRLAMRAEDGAVVDTLLSVRRDRGPFDLELLLLRGVDPVSHFFWKYHEPDASAYTPDERPSAAAVAEHGDVVRAHYRFADARIGELLAGDGSQRAVLLISDHGFEAGRQPFHDGAVLSGTHESESARQGIFVAAGGPFRRDIAIEEVSIFDIAPTVLTLLQLGVPDDWPGKVLTQALDAGWVARHPEQRVKTPAYVRPEAVEGSAADAALEAELRALGYIK